MPGKRKDAITINATERTVQALELRKRGKSYRAIGAALGVSEAQAFRDVQAALMQLNALEQTTAEELRRVEVERLDALLDALWTQATSPGMKGQTFAVDRVLSIMERRSRLLGLDAPARSQQETSGNTTIRVEYVDTDNPAPTETP